MTTNSAFKAVKGKDAFLLFDSGTTYNGTINKPVYVEHELQIYKTTITVPAGSFDIGDWSLVGGQTGTTTFIKAFQFAASDESTSLTTGNTKVTVRLPYAISLTEVRASLSTAQASGSTLTVDINRNGTSILGTKLTIDNTSKTSVGATTPPTITTVNLSDDDEITLDIDQVGSGTVAKGLKITLLGT